MPIGLAIPFIIIGANADDMSEGGAIFAIVYWAFLFFANIHPRKIYNANIFWTFITGLSH